MEVDSFTRGQGLLETWLSKQRARRANRLIAEHLREGRVLDLGCGTYPYFLSRTRFREKYSVDQVAMPGAVMEKLGITHRTMDLQVDRRLPFESEMFNVVTLLALIEHVEPEVAVQVLREAHRVLAPNGRVILTTPAAWTDKLLRLMARVRMVSAEEIHEHAFGYRLPTLGCCLGQAGFHMQKLACGTFQLGMNLWAVATK
jgi:ubiquinone/menaquinone biosynthesis C-methylase UbiE